MHTKLSEHHLNSVVEKLKVLCNSKGINGIATVLCVSGPGLHGAIKKGELPYKALVMTAIDKGWSLDDLLAINVCEPLNLRSSAGSNVESDEVGLSDSYSTEMLLETLGSVLHVLDNYFGPTTEVFKALGPERIYEVHVKLCKIMLEQALRNHGNREVLDVIAKTSIALL